MINRNDRQKCMELMHSIARDDYYQNYTDGYADNLNMLWQLFCNIDMIKPTPGLNFNVRLAIAAENIFCDNKKLDTNFTYTDIKNVIDNLDSIHNDLFHYSCFRILRHTLKVKWTVDKKDWSAYVAIHGDLILGKCKFKRNNYTALPKVYSIEQDETWTDMLGQQNTSVGDYIILQTRVLGDSVNDSPMGIHRVLDIANEYIITQELDSNTVWVSDKTTCYIHFNTDNLLLYKLSV